MGKHYNPQQLLRGFADPFAPEMVWQFDKSNGTFTSTHVSIKRVAQERDFYPEEVEDDLTQHIENPGNEVIAKLRLGNYHLTEEEKATLSRYIATMMQRVPANRLLARKLAPVALSKASDKLHRAIRDHATANSIDIETVNKALAETNGIEARILSQPPEHVVSMLNDPFAPSVMVEAIRQMYWRFVIGTDEHRFLTSDNPVFVFESLGLANENGRSEFTFSVSSTLAIFGSWCPIRRPSDRVVRDAKIAKEANRRIVVGATRFVYSPRKYDWIAQLAMNSARDLKPIEW